MILEITTIAIWLLCSGADVSQCIAAVQEKYPNCEIKKINLSPILLGSDKIEVQFDCAEFPVAQPIEND